MDFYARQEAARRTTRWLLVAFLISVALVVVAVDAVVAFAVGAAEPGASPVKAVVGSSIVVLGIICGASLFKTLSLRAGGGAVARSLGGTRIERATSDIALKRLHNVVEEMSIASGVTMPEVYVLEHEDGINAFAAGNSPADAAIAVTRGAATRLKREELQGVIAHEFSHILNGDMRLNVRLLGWTFGLLAVAIVARVVLQSSPSSGRSRKDGAGALMLAALAAMVLGYIGVFFGRLLQAAVSRHRERLADASAVQFTRNPVGLSGALLKIAGASAGSRLVTPEAEEVAHMLFAAGLPRLFATHPPIEERLKALDPSFRAGDLPKLAAEAARDSERQRADDAAHPPVFGPASSGPAIANTTAFAQAGDRSIRGQAPHEIAALAGTIANENVRYAENARIAIPEGLRDFVDSADHARALMLVVLASKIPEVQAEQRRILEGAYGPEFAARVFGMQSLADSLAPALRLPAVQQLFPALRRLSLAERQKLRDVVARLANADARIDVFECCLTLLLAANLDDLNAGPLHGSASLMQEIAAIHTLFAILAAQGTGDDTRARRAYEAGISVVLPEHRPAFEQIAQWPKALADSLARLASLRPFAKKVLIEGLVRCIAHDQKLSVEEGELLRTVCSVLHCPLPPILATPGGS
jgi:Zn-dependent protease with chaperone function